jgi:hypothetical protein
LDLGRAAVGWEEPLDSPLLHVRSAILIADGLSDSVDRQKCERLLCGESQHR